MRGQIFAVTIAAVVVAVVCATGPELVDLEADHHEIAHSPDYLGESIGVGRRGRGTVTTGTTTIVTSEGENSEGNGEEGNELGEAAKARTVVETNGAKCAGNTQDQGVVLGTLDCKGSKDDGNENEDIGKDCLDNLSQGKVWVAEDQDQGKCKPLSAKGTDGGALCVQRTITCTAKSGPYKGLITKMAVAHPHDAPLYVGVIGLKRLKCDTTKCEVYKNVVCIKSDKDMWTSKHESLATSDEKVAFIEYVTANAWDDAGTANAEVKENWQCANKDRAMAQGWALAF